MIAVGCVVLAAILAVAAYVWGTTRAAVQRVIHDWRVNE